MGGMLDFDRSFPGPLHPTGLPGHAEGLRPPLRLLVLPAPGSGGGGPVPGGRPPGSERPWPRRRLGLPRDSSRTGCAWTGGFSSSAWSARPSPCTSSGSGNTPTPNWPPK
ncbi:MAG: hypothetical protein MZU95_15620 [Desulfomicrobium escambiense]|nr:hypothetical protein [Desulfomicrobium escambiense]